MNGEGSVYQRSSDNLWIGAVHLGYDEQGKAIRKTVSGRTKSIVLGKLRKEQRQVEDGLPPSDDRVTLNQLLDRWFDHVLRHQVEQSALDNYKSVAEHHIRPTLGRVRLAKLSAEDVDALISAKIDEGYATSTVRRIRSVLSQALDQGVRWGLVTRNVVAMTRGPKAQRREGRSLTPEQARDLLKAAKGTPGKKGNRLEALYVTILALGLRSGEALGLAWNDVDLTKRVLWVRHALKREGNKLVIGEVKTPKSRRSIDLPVSMVKVLRAHKAQQAKERLAAGESWQNQGLVFTTEVGTPIDPSNLRRDFDKLCAKAGLGHWHPHELRHSAATLMLAQGVAIEVVAEVLGHSSIRMTADVYTHVQAPQRKLAATAMESALWS
jgi:integrase